MSNDCDFKISQVSGWHICQFCVAGPRKNGKMTKNLVLSDYFTKLAITKINALNTNQDLF